MQDHFLQLGLDPEASAADIESAIKAKPELEAAAAVLLNERRRAAYQRAVSTLRSIGMLRHRLGLDNESTWFTQTCPDFAPRLHHRKYAAQPAAQPADDSMAETTTATATKTSGATSTSTKTGAGKAGRPWLQGAIAILILLAVLVILALAL